jgi:hypothetical protein
MHRIMRVTACLLLAGWGAAADAPPSWLAEAIRLGSTKKLDPYAAPGLAVTYTTPFLRVARAANKAVREGRTLRPADVEPQAYVPELRVLVGVLPVTGNGRLLGMAAPKSARLTLGAGEVQPKRMDQGTEKQSVSVGGAPPREVSGGVLKAVFEVTGPPPAGGELEVRYVWSRDGREREIVERVPLDFRKTRW